MVTITQPFRTLAVASSIVLCLAAMSRAEKKYKTFEEARSAGAKLVGNQQYAEAQAPLEAALRLAPDDKARLSVYQALVPVYRTLPEIDKKLEANEFLIAHAERQTGRTLASRDLVSFLHQRGKIDAAIERYDARLKADPKDHAALAVLTGIYTQVKRDKQRADELGKRLEEVERELSRSVAQRLEKEADAAGPQSAASLLKDAAGIWLEAGEKAKALAVAERSASGPPERRNDLLTFYWREGLGDVFLAAGAPQQAVAQFEAALAVVKLEGQRKSAEKKLAAAKEAAARQ